MSPDYELILPPPPSQKTQTKALKHAPCNQKWFPFPLPRGQGLENPTIDKGSVVSLLSVRPGTWLHYWENDEGKI